MFERFSEQGRQVVVLAAGRGALARPRPHRLASTCCSGCYASTTISSSCSASRTTCAGASSSWSAWARRSHRASSPSRRRQGACSSGARRVRPTSDDRAAAARARAARAARGRDGDRGARRARRRAARRHASGSSRLRRRGDRGRRRRAGRPERGGAPRARDGCAPRRGRARPGRAHRCSRSCSRCPISRRARIGVVDGGIVQERLAGLLEGPERSRVRRRAGHRDPRGRLKNVERESEDVVTPEHLLLGAARGRARRGRPRRGRSRCDGGDRPRVAGLRRTTSRRAVCTASRRRRATRSRARPRRRDRSITPTSAPSTCCSA